MRIADDRDEGAFIRLRGICKTFTSADGVVPALTDVSLDIFAGEMVAVVGPSGSGKSTCANIIGCLDTPTSGRYQLADREVTLADAHSRGLLRREMIGFVFQSYNLLSHATALENVALPLVYRDVPSRERTARAMEALDAVGLGDHTRRLPSELSGGQQQRVAIARALACQPKLVIADEPTAALDPEAARGVVRLLGELSRSDGITVVMVTHDAALAAAAQRTIEFSDSRIVRDRSTRTLP